jgi:hypothetical protein
MKERTGHQVCNSSAEVIRQLVKDNLSYNDKVYKSLVKILRREARVDSLMHRSFDPQFLIGGGKATGDKPDVIRILPADKIKSNGHK